MAVKTRSNLIIDVEYIILSLNKSTVVKLTVYFLFFVFRRRRRHRCFSCCCCWSLSSSSLSSRCNTVEYSLPFRSGFGVSVSLEFWAISQYTPLRRPENNTSSIIVTLIVKTYVTMRIINTCHRIPLRPLPTIKLPSGCMTSACWCRSGSIFTSIFRMQTGCVCDCGR